MVLSKSKTHIIIVDDDMKEDDVEVETLKEYYQNVHLFPRGKLMVLLVKEFQ